MHMHMSGLSFVGEYPGMICNNSPYIDKHSRKLELMRFPPCNTLVFWHCISSGNNWSGRSKASIEYRNWHCTYQAGVRHFSLDFRASPQYWSESGRNL
jgi:hypothetical protein